MPELLFVNIVKKRKAQVTCKQSCVFIVRDYNMETS